MRSWLPRCSPWWSLSRMDCCILRQHDHHSCSQVLQYRLTASSGTTNGAVLSPGGIRQGNHPRQRERGGVQGTSREDRVVLNLHRLILNLRQLAALDPQPTSASTSLPLNPSLLPSSSISFYLSSVIFIYFFFTFETTFLSFLLLLFTMSSSAHSCRPTRGSARRRPDPHCPRAP